MACGLDTGFSRDCSDSVGGIEEFYLLERSSVTDYVETAHVVTAITDGGATWHKYELKKEVGSVTAPVTISPENGTRFSEAKLAFSINKFSAAKSNELKLMILGQVIAIVKTNNNKYLALGFQSFAEGSAYSLNTGQSYGDRNGYEIELTAREPETPYEVDPAVITGLVIV
jgi:hypothetical protein